MTHTRQETADPGLAMLIAVGLLCLVALGAVDRHTEATLDRPSITTSTITADDPDAVATTTSTPGGDGR